MSQRTSKKSPWEQPSPTVDFISTWKRDFFFPSFSNYASAACERSFVPSLNWKISKSVWVTCVSSAGSVTEQKLSFSKPQPWSECRSPKSVLQKPEMLQPHRDKPVLVQHKDSEDCFLISHLCCSDFVGFRQLKAALLRHGSKKLLDCRRFLFRKCKCRSFEVF